MWADRWGVTDAETRRPYACDDYVPAPTLEAWRGVTVHAPSEAVWPWLVQVRLAPYSYDWVDNGGRRSPRRPVDLPDPRVGDPFTATAGRDQGRIVAVDPGRHLTATILGAYLTYALDPAVDGPADRTRLVLKVIGAPPRWLAPLASVGDLVMARRQLLTLAGLAEGGRAD